MTRALAAAIVIAALLAGCSGGPKEAGPVPTGQKQKSHSSVSTSGAATAASASVPLCNDENTDVRVDSQEGAAGTIMTTWRVMNTSSGACRSLGYPGMDFHAAGGWLDVQVQRGGVDIVNGTPSSVAVEPGESLYFVSLWGDVDTEQGPCKQFDRIKVTLPDNFTPTQIDSSGCVEPNLVRVGPVSSSRPSS